MLVATGLSMATRRILTDSLDLFEKTLSVLCSGPFPLAVDELIYRPRQGGQSDVGRSILPACSRSCRAFRSVSQIRPHKATDVEVETLPPSWPLPER
jgi:hypothetical protein